MRHAQIVSWVVYRMPIKRHPEGLNAVCEQTEWDAMQLGRPGYYTLIREGMTNECEAEKLARGTSGDRPPRKFRGKPAFRVEEEILFEASCSDSSEST
jgi:hypothetical protein